MSLLGGEPFVAGMGPRISTLLIKHGEWNMGTRGTGRERNREKNGGRGGREVEGKYRREWRPVEVTKRTGHSF